MPEGEHEEGDQPFATEDSVEDIEKRLKKLESEWSAQGAGYSLGASLAMILSWHSFHAVLWAVLAGAFSWFYVIYYLVMHWADVRLL
jgi:hypothetical protein